MSPMSEVITFELKLCRGKRSSQCNTKESDWVNCWFAAVVMAAMLVDKNKAFTLTGNLTLLSCKFCKKIICCSVHQHSHPVTWFQTKKLSLKYILEHLCWISTDA